MISKGSFAQIYQNSNTKTKEFEEFIENINNQTEQLCDNNMQQFLVIWGDPKSKESDMSCLIEKFPFLINRIYQFSDSLTFRFMSINLSQKNILFVMSGKFAYEKYGGTTNLEWLNDKIIKQEIHSKSIIIFTSENFIIQNQLTIEKLQLQFKYVTQIAAQYNQLITSFDKMIHNRIHSSFVQNKNLDFYFGSKVKQVLMLFQCHDNQIIQSINLEKEKENLKKLCQYCKKANIQSPLELYLEDSDIKSIHSIFEQFSNINTLNYSQKEIVSKILNLYTQESVLYKLINLSINTMNVRIYRYLMRLYRLFSKCLYQFQDDYQKNEVKLYRGCAIQTYQYDTLYQEYLHNENNQIPTFICFPQFLSTSLLKEVATLRKIQMVHQVQLQQAQRIKNTQQQYLQNQKYSKSKWFDNNYEVLIEINAKIDYKNKYKPKYIAKISSHEYEEEFLFQPFQSFRIDYMQQGDGINQSSKKMILFYCC